MPADKRAPVTIDNESGNAIPEGKVERVARPVRFTVVPPRPSIDSVLDTLARDMIEGIARDAAKSIRRAVRRGFRR